VEGALRYLGLVRRPGLSQLITTVETREQALELAHAVVDGRVAACVQILGPITSVYRWEGRVEQAEEFLLLMKAPSERLMLLSRFVRERHPYDTPEVTAVESSFVDARYLAWTREVTATTPNESP
jgi:periplasmic divalent cation tolerance protein